MFEIIVFLLFVIFFNYYQCERLKFLTMKQECVRT